MVRVFPRRFRRSKDKIVRVLIVKRLTMKYLLFDGKAWFDRTPGASIEREADDMLQRYDVVKNCRLSKPLTKPPRGMGCPGAQGGGSTTHESGKKISAGPRGGGQLGGTA